MRDGGRRLCGDVFRFLQRIGTDLADAALVVGGGEMRGQRKTFVRRRGRLIVLARAAAA
jgi:hypothetical protein